MTSKSRNISVRSKIIHVIWLPVLVLLVACFYAIWCHYWNIARLIEHRKCPACYGESLCPVIWTNPDLLKVHYWGYFGWIANSFTTKNVYQGSLDSVEVMIKRLGHEWELTEIDEKLCKRIPQFCKNKVVSSNELLGLVLDDLRSLLSNRLESEHKVNLMRFCPTFENLETALKGIDKPTKGNILTLTGLLNIWTILHINAEPIVVQLFPKDEGWPFPQYLGACGRIIVQTYEGSPLLDFYNESWDVRARLSLQLLNAVDKFTHHNPDLALYLLDYSPDNIAVNANNTVSFVDLEHVIIVDKHSSFFSGKHNLLHQSGAFCHDADCSYYSPDDICTHQISDFNHYMLCKEILAPSEDSFVTMPQGLLHSTPGIIRKKYPVFESALKNCSCDSNVNHMTPAQILRDILQELTERDGEYKNTYCGSHKWLLTAL